MMWRVNERVVGRRLDDSYVLVNLETQEMFELNSSGARIWELMLEQTSLPELERSLMGEFVGDPATVRRDLEDLIGDLVLAGMLREAPITAIDPSASPSEWMISWTPADAAPVIRRGVAPHRTIDVRASASGWSAMTGSSTDDGVVVEWDASARTLIAHRDPIGIVPCYYAWDGRSFSISSSVDPLLARPGVSREIHRLHLAEYV